MCLSRWGSSCFPLTLWYSILRGCLRLSLLLLITYTCPTAVDHGDIALCEVKQRVDVLLSTTFNLRGQAAMTCFGLSNHMHSLVHTWHTGIVWLILPGLHWTYRTTLGRSKCRHLVVYTLTHSFPLGPLPLLTLNLAFIVLLQLLAYITLNRYGSVDQLIAVKVFSS